MSGIEVVAAVSAVVSAFHAGSELLKHVQQRRRKARAKQQEFEEKQLQDSLISGEQQISFRYTQDVREFGDIVRVGDAIARDRLQHIAIMLQMEIIKSLQMAAKHETAILNLRLLHEASITNRKDTFVVLDEMKYGINMMRPIARQLEDVSAHRSSIATMPSSRSSTFDPVIAVPPEYIPSAVTFASQGGMKESKSALARLFQPKRSSSASSKSVPNDTPPETTNINHSAALEQLMRAKGQDRVTTMEDIDEIMVLYKGLDSGTKPPDEPLAHEQAPEMFGQRRDTLNMLNGGGSPLSPQVWDSTSVDNGVPSSSQPHAGYTTQSHSVFNVDMFNGRQPYPSSPATNLYSQNQAQTPHRLSSGSNSSAPYSDMSWTRNDSNSTQSSYAPSSPQYATHPSQLNKPGYPYSASPDATFQHPSEQRGIHSSPPVPYATTEENLTIPIAPLVIPRKNPLRVSPQHGGPASPPNASNMPSSSTQEPSDSNQQHILRAKIAPFASPPESPEPKVAVRVGSNPSRPDLRSPVMYDAASYPSSSSERTITPVFGMPTSSGPRTISAPILPRFRQPSIASTDSSGSGSVGVLPRPVGAIGSATVHGPQPGQERLMGGRPCKDNNYWGFCKGAWDVREETKKGLALRNMPSGMYNTKEVWACRQCNFRGNTYNITYGKKGKTETIVDPNIHTSKSGVRYRWIFLAKSHVKKKTPDSSNEECNYGCVICSVEKKATSIFGDVETLMYHLLEHVGGMTQTTMMQTRCIVGKTAGPGEEWDINVPLFADISEVPG